MGEHSGEIGCPRCGYDLSGEPARWVDQCPLETICPECGTGVAWADVFDPSRRELEWFAEHGPARGVAARLVPTLRRIFGVLPFWRSVSVLHRVRLQRAAGWLGGAMLLLHLLGSGTGLATGFAYGRPLNAHAIANSVGFPIVSMGQFSVPALLVDEWPLYMVPAIVFATAWPAMFAVLPTTRRLAKLRPAHLARAWMYSLAWLPLLCVFRIGRNIWLLAQLSAMPRSAAPTVFVALPRQPMPLRLSEVAPELLGTLLFAWIAAWWLTAAKVGWRLHMGTLVWFLLCLAAGLLALVVDRAMY